MKTSAHQVVEGSFSNRDRAGSIRIGRIIRNRTKKRRPQTAAGGFKRLLFIASMMVAISSAALLQSACTHIRGSCGPFSMTEEHAHRPGHPVTLRFPAGASTDMAVASLGGSLVLGNGVTFKEPSGAFSSATQVGKGRVCVGIDTQIDSITAESSIVLRDRARVSGDVTTGGLIHEGHDVIVEGHRKVGAVVTPYVLESWEIEKEDNPHQPIAVPASGHMVLAPGAYGHVALRSQGRLRLSSGAYGFSSMHVFPNATLEIDDTLGPVRVYIYQELIFRGQVRSVYGGHPALLVVQTGSRHRCLLDAPFRGTVVVPDAPLELSRGPHPHEGSFFGRCVRVQSGTTVVHRPFLRLEPIQRWSVPISTLGPFAVGALDDTGGLLTNGERAVIKVTHDGAVDTLLELAQPHRFVIDPVGLRFGVLTPNQLEVRDRSGALIAAHNRTPSGYAQFVPHTNLVFLPELKEGGLGPSVVTHARFFDPSGLRFRFKTPDLRISRLTSSHLIYATRTELVRTTLAGVETWRLPLRLVTFEVSSNGATLIGVLDERGSAKIVHVDLGSGTVGTETPLDGAFWSIAAAPLGRYTVATTQSAVYVFDHGRLSRHSDLGVRWTVSTDVSDQGYVALGAQLASHESLLILVGPSGPGVSRVSRAIEYDGYRPGVRFFPDGKALLLNESSGLKAYDIHFVH